MRIILQLSCGLGVCPDAHQEENAKREWKWASDMCKFVNAYAVGLQDIPKVCKPKGQPPKKAMSTAASPYLHVPVHPPFTRTRVPVLSIQIFM